MAAKFMHRHFSRAIAPATLATTLLLGACASPSNAPKSASEPWAPPQVDAAWRELAMKGPAAVASQNATTATSSDASSNNNSQLPAAATPDFDRVYDLPALIDLAQRSNPATRLAWNQARQAASAVGITDATFLPRLSAYVVGGYESTRHRLPEILNHTFHLDTKAKGIVPVLALEWLLFDFGEREAASQAAQHLATGANFLFNSVHQQVIFSVSTAYYQYGAAKHRHQIAEESLRNSLAVETAVDAKRKAGLATSVEEAQARQLVAQARLAVVSSAGAERNAWQALLDALNIEPGTPLQVNNSADLPLPTAQDLPDGAVLRRALADRPDIMASIASLKAAESAVNVAKADFLPKLALVGVLMSNNNTLTLGNLPGLNQGANTRGVLLGLSIPLYDGGMRRSRLHQAEYGVEAAQAALEKLRSAAMREIVVAANMLETSLQAYDAASTLVQTATITYDAALGAYEAGLGTVTVSTEAANGLLTARSARADAHAAAQVAATTLAFALGQLNSVTPPSRGTTDSRSQQGLAPTLLPIDATRSPE